MNKDLVEQRLKTIDSKLDQLISEMTLEEKVLLCHASTKFGVAGIERLGIPEVEMSDGPHGVRQEISKDSWEPAGWDNDHATYLPTGTAQAAAWNTEMMTEAGKVLGAEARKREKDYILGPGFNIVRTPICGRNFEYYGEDPYMNAKLAVNAVEGIQSQDVAACVKHYAANSQELNRSFTDVEMDERTLREIYLPAFEATVKEAGILSVMGAYNKFRGQYCCHNKYLVNDILKEEWGFIGTYISDWNGVHSTDEAASNGMDIEMGTEAGSYDDYYLAKPYLEGLKSGKYSMETLNDKVRRNLRVMHMIGMFDENRLPGRINIPEHQEVALKIAEEAIVLLKNDDNLLPLDKTKIKKLAIIGNNAKKLHSEGGNSSAVKALYEVSPFEGVTAKLGDNVEIIYAEGYPENESGLIPINTEFLSTVDQGSGVKGWSAEFFNNRYNEGDSVAERYEENTLYSSKSYKLPDGVADVLFSIRWTGELTAPETGEYEFGIRTDGNSKVYIDGELVLQTEIYLGSETKSIKLNLTAGQKSTIVVEYGKSNNGNLFQFGWKPCWMEETDGESSLFDQAVNAAKEADAVLFFGGLNHLFDVEGKDRPDMKLPGGQDELIKAIVDENKNTTVCLVAGSPVEMPWVDEVPSVVQMWYAGMEGGNAIANILFGDINPSGKLPFTFPEKFEDCPAHKIGTYTEELSKYTEGVMVGYRYYDTENVDVLFPFGHGLSYTSFEYSDLKIEKGDDCVACVSVDITNTGDVAGAEVVQLYLQDVECSVARPLKELKGFDKVFLEAGETKTVQMKLTQRDLSFYDVDSKDWLAEPGEFKVHIGSSVSDIRLTDTFEY